MFTYTYYVRAVVRVHPDPIQVTDVGGLVAQSVRAYIVAVRKYVKKLLTQPLN